MDGLLRNAISLDIGHRCVNEAVVLHVADGDEIGHYRKNEGGPPNILLSPYMTAKPSKKYKEGYFDKKQGCIEKDLDDETGLQSPN